MHRQIYKLYTYTHIYIYIYIFFYACMRRTQGTTKAHVFSRWTTTAPPEELSGPWDRGVSFTDGPHRHLRLWIFAYNTPNRQAVNQLTHTWHHRSVGIGAIGTELPCNLLDDYRDIVSRQGNCRVTNVVSPGAAVRPQCSPGFRIRV